MSRCTPQVGCEHDAPDRVRVKGPLTFDQIGALLGTSRRNAHQIYKKAMRKIRARMKRN